MSDVIQSWRFQQILVHAARYQMLRSIYENDRRLEPRTVATLRACFAAHRDAAAELRQTATDGAEPK